MKKLAAAVTAALFSLVAFANAAEVTYDITNTPAKPTTAFPDGRHGIWLPHFFSNSDNSFYWSFENDATFTYDDATGEAQLTGTVTNVAVSDFQFEVEINLFGMTEDGPRFCSGQTCVSGGTDMLLWSWGQDDVDNGLVAQSTLTGVGVLDGMVVNISDFSNGAHRFQFGLGGDAFTQALLGGSGWMTWDVMSDPTVTPSGYTFRDTPKNGKHGDVNFVTTPVPAAAALFLTGLAAVAARRRRRAA